MATTIHFEIDADDVERAKRFYERVFGWKIWPWGPPDYYLLATDAPHVAGDIRKRDSSNSAAGRRGFVCTIGVVDLKATASIVLTSGGKIDTKEILIEGVGNLMYFLDTEGNRFGVMQRVSHA